MGKMFFVLCMRKSIGKKGKVAAEDISLSTMPRPLRARYSRPEITCEHMQLIIAPLLPLASSSNLRSCLSAYMAWIACSDSPILLTCTVYQHTLHQGDNIYLLCRTASIPISRSQQHSSPEDMRKACESSTLVAPAQQKQSMLNSKADQDNDFPDNI